MKVKGYSIKDVCDVFDGPHATPSPSVEGPIYLGITSIREDGSIDYENSKRIAWDEFPKWTKRVTPKAGDVVFSYEANLGTYAIIPEGFVGCLGRRMAVMRPRADKALPKYLYYYMLSPRWKEVIASKTVLGATVNRIPIASYPDFPIELPDVGTQAKVVAVLSAYDELIENNRRQIKLLEEAAQRLYKEWFVDLKFPGHETTPINNGLPEGWERKHLREFADVVMGQSPKSEYYNDKHQGLPFHQGVGSYGERYVIDKTFCTQPTRIARAGSVLFSVRAPVGRLNIAKNEIIIGRGLAALNHHGGKQSFLFYLFKERFFEDNLLGNGAIFSSIDKQELLALSFLIPDLATIDCFEKVVAKIDEKIKELDDQKNLLAEARDRLLPKLMSGEIEV